MSKSEGWKKQRCQETNNAEQYKETNLVRSSYGMEWTFFEARGMRSMAGMLTIFLFPHLIQSDG